MDPMLPASLFFQSDVENPYALYAQRLHHQPLAWDEQSQLWAAYGYDSCQQLLHHPSLAIPVPAPLVAGEPSASVESIRGNLVRLSNPPRHETVRALTTHLMRAMQPVAIPSLLANLLRPFEASNELDWVEVVAKKLPVSAVLAGFSFGPAQAACIAVHMGLLTKLMVPHATIADGQAINQALEDLVPMVEAHIQRTPRLQALLMGSPNAHQTRSLLVSNLLGLLIQSYDAGRGLLTNALIQVLAHGAQYQPMTMDLLRRMVVETLRFDPPIHHTRRLLTTNLFIGDQRLRQGQTVLLVLAAANRDPVTFARAHEFDPARASNDSLLSFGTGMHACLARHLAVEQTAQALHYLLTHYPGVGLVDAPVHYERLMNARLRCTLRIQLT